MGDWTRADWLALIGILAAVGFPGALIRMGWRAVRHLGDIRNGVVALQSSVKEVRDWTINHASEHRQLTGVLDKIVERLENQETRLNEHGEALRVHAALLREEGR